VGSEKAEGQFSMGKSKKFNVSSTVLLALSS